ncbi:hypothetical protein LCGC14_3114420, partial [marine sediment metagenome]
MKKYEYKFLEWPAGDLGIEDPNAMEDLNEIGESGWLLVGKTIKLSREYIN